MSLQNAPPSTRRVARYGYRNAGAAYPAQSSAWSGSANSLWWQATYNGALHLCSSQGATVTKALQAYLQRTVPTSFDVNGNTFVNGLAIDANLGPDSFAALVWALQNAVAAPADMLQAVLADYARLTDALGRTRSSARGAPVAYLTQCAIIWLAAHNDQPAGIVTVPDNIATTHFATTAPDDGAADGNVTCVLMSDITGLPGASGSGGAAGGAAGATGTAPSSSSGFPPLLAVALLGFAAVVSSKRKKG